MRFEPLPPLLEHPFPAGEGDARYRHRRKLTAPGFRLIAYSLGPPSASQSQTRPRDARAAKLMTRSYRLPGSYLAPASVATAPSVVCAAFSPNLKSSSVYVV